MLKPSTGKLPTEQAHPKRTLRVWAQKAAGMRTVVSTRVRMEPGWGIPATDAMKWGAVRRGRTRGNAEPKNDAITLMPCGGVRRTGSQWATAAQAGIKPGHRAPLTREEGSDE